MVGDGVGHQRQIAFPCDLLHDLGLSDPGRSHQEHGSLADPRNAVFSAFILLQVSFYRMFNLFFSALDIHATPHV